MTEGVAVGPGARESCVVHVAVGALVNAAGAVLVTRRPEHVHQGGLWEFPGGKVEPGESVRQALERELREELGVVVGRARPLIRVRHRYPERTVLLDVWRVDVYRGEAHGREGQPLAWRAPGDLDPADFPEADAPIIEALRRGGPTSRWLPAAAMGAAVIVAGLAAAAFLVPDAHRAPLALAPPDVSLDASAGCDPTREECAAAGAGLGVGLALGGPVEALRPFEVAVAITAQGQPPPTAVTLDLRMVGMDMGPNRVRLAAQGGRWRGQALVPVCGFGRTDWLATVVVEGGGVVHHARFPFRMAR